MLLLLVLPSIAARVKQPVLGGEVRGSDRSYWVPAYLSYQSSRTAAIGRNTLDRTHFPQFCGGMWVLASHSDQ